MKWQTLSDAERLLDRQVRARFCSQLWVSRLYNALFIGFGSSVLPSTLPGERHPVPDYELETGFTDWWVENGGETIVSNKNDRELAESTASVLVGLRVVGWELVNRTPALRIVFERGYELRMKPYDDEEYLTERAWVIRGPTFYGMMRWDGTMVRGRRDKYLL